MLRMSGAVPLLSLHVFHGVDRQNYYHPLPLYLHNLSGFIIITYLLTYLLTYSMEQSPS